VTCPKKYTITASKIIQKKRDRAPVFAGCCLVLLLAGGQVVRTCLPLLLLLFRDRRWCCCRDRGGWDLTFHQVCALEVPSDRVELLVRTAAATLGALEEGDLQGKGAEALVRDEVRFVLEAATLEERKSIVKQSAALVAHDLTVQEDLFVTVVEVAEEQRLLGVGPNLGEQVFHDLHHRHNAVIILRLHFDGVVDAFGQVGVRLDITSALESQSGVLHGEGAQARSSADAGRALCLACAAGLAAGIDVEMQTEYEQLPRDVEVLRDRSYLAVWT